MNTSTRWGLRASEIGAGMTPALALCLPSGYSWGAAWLALAGLVFSWRWLGKAWDRRAIALALSLAVMAVVWGLSFDANGLGSGSDAPLKYGLAIVALGLLQWAPPRAGWWIYGAALGGIGAGLTAFYQRFVQHIDRATGYTNAIQFGDVAVFLGMACGLVLLLNWKTEKALGRMSLLAGMLGGLVASLLSDSRGGWVTLPLWAGVAALAMWQQGLRRAVMVGVAAMVLAMVVLGSWQSHKLAPRFAQIFTEVQQYQESGDSLTSVGQRLAQAKLAWAMGWARPWTGWGMQGLVQEKQRRVEQGLAPASTLDYGHAHNEMLDMFARRGLVGVAALLGFYAVPLLIFWPTARRMAQAWPGQRQQRQALALRIVGVMLPLSYAGFGLTQVFFAHNSGHLTYVFFNALVLASLIGLERQATGVVRAA